MNNGLYKIRPGGMFNGSIHENGVSIRAFMQKDSMLRIEGDGRGVRVSSSEGTLWITQENDLEDHFLMPGKIFMIERQGLAIIYALTESNLRMW